MFKKIISIGVLAAVLSVASGVNVFAQTNLTNESQTVSVNTEAQKRQEIFLKKEFQQNSEEKDNLATYNKQKSQGGKFSTSTKILIGVGIAAAVVGVVVFAATRTKIDPFKNGVL